MGRSGCRHPPFGPSCPPKPCHGAITVWTLEEYVHSHLPRAARAEQTPSLPSSSSSQGHIWFLGHPWILNILLALPALDLEGGQSPHQEPHQGVKYSCGVQRCPSWGLVHLQTQFPQPSVPSDTRGGGPALALMPTALPTAQGRW